MSGSHLVAEVVAGVVTVAAATPAGEDPDRPPDELIGPGTIGFIAIFLLSVAIILLVRDMNRRVQRMRYQRMAREDAQEGTAQEGTAQQDPDGRDPSAPT